MKRGMSLILATCFVFSLGFLEGALAGDYTISVVNNIHKFNNNFGSPCGQVSFSYWSADGGKMAKLSNELASTQTASMTVQNVGACTSMEIYASCHFFHKGGGSSVWTDETEIKQIPCWCKMAQIGLREASNIQYLDITCLQ